LNNSETSFKFTNKFTKVVDTVYELVYNRGIKYSTGGLYEKV